MSGLLLGAAARDALRHGVDAVADAALGTLGPGHRHVMLAPRTGRW
ncbi:hypothetical protein ACWD4L_35190 [Streptomyces sp. NPDC002596]